MNSPASAAAPQPVPPSLRNAFGGVWRLTFPGFFSPGRLLRVAGLLAALGLLTLATTRTGHPAAFFDWTIKFHLTFLVPVLAFIAGGGVMRDNWKPESVDYTFTRPLPRPAFVAFQYLSHLAGAQAKGLLALGVLLGVGVCRGVPNLAAALPLLVLAQVLAITVFTAFGFLCGSLTARYLIVGLTYSGIVEVGIGNLPTQISRLSLIHHLRALLQPLTPGPLTAAPLPDAAVTSVLLLLVSIVMIAVAAAVFGRRELAGGKPRDN